MEDRAKKKLKKMAILKVMHKHKDILFKQNNATTKFSKQKAWQEVLEKAISSGLAKETHDWTYARDHLFGLWKSRAIARKRKTLRNVDAYKEIDKAVLDILGADSIVWENIDDDAATNVDAIAKATEDEKLNMFERHFENKFARNAGNETETLKKQLLEAQIYKNKLHISN